MSPLRKGRPHDQNTDSPPDQDLRERHNEGNEIYLPDSKKAFMTNIKTGNSALGRKKPESLLQDFGFDVLGQSLGIPSRMDIERRPRRISTESQDSRVTMNPNAAHQYTARTVAKKDHHIYELDGSSVTFEKSGVWSPSTAVPDTPHHRKGTFNNDFYHDSATKAAYPYPMAEPFNPPPPPPLPPAYMWNVPSMTNKVSPMPPNCASTIYHPIRSPDYTAEFPSADILPNWGLPHSHLTPSPKHRDSLRSKVPRTASMPLDSHKRHLPTSASYPETAFFARTTHVPGSVPPPPPPPPPLPQQSSAARLRGGSLPEARDNIPVWNHEEAEKCEAHYRSVAGAKAKASKQEKHRKREAKGKNSRAEREKKARQYVSNRIRHTHVCAGCGKRRSKGYRKAHPLKEGQIPEADYCYRCIRDAAISGASQSYDYFTDDGSFKKYADEPPVSTPSTDEGRMISSGHYVRGKTRHGPRWMKRSRRFGFLANIFSGSATPRTRSKPPTSLSSAEEASSRASSPIPGPKVPRNIGKYTRFSSHKTVYGEGNRDSMSTASETRSSLRSLIDENIAKNAETGACKTPSDSIVNDESNKRTSLPKPGTSDTPPNYPRNEGISLPPRPVTPDKCSPTSHPTESKASAKTPRGFSSQHKSETVEVATGRNEARAKKAKPLDSPYMQPRIHNESSEVSAAADSSESHHNEPRSNFSFQSKLNRPASNAWFGSAGKPRTADVLTEEHIAFPEMDWQYTHSWEPYTPNDCDYAFKWEMPPTPTDLPYFETTVPPHIVNDPWGINQADIEREAEELAEQYLAEAGKRFFTDFENSFRGSGTSSFPTSSYLTRSTISIESCSHCDDRTDSKLVYELVSDSDAEQTVKNEDKSAKKLEFSSHEDKNQKTTSRIPSGARFASDSHTRKGQLESPKLCAKNLYSLDERESNYSSDMCALSPDSSMVGHTGHSADDLAMNSSKRVGSWLDTTVA
ncbi:hypothetical protein F4779DRAFT_640978 [Xylariaceae sp. FL0662B]|nr:hypothetical protein F4779DRAFT_640978 [Xylariaceae sp. FL0662B]